MKIANNEISLISDKVFVIAEVGNNHNGSFARAIEMVQLAKQMGADCVKFQMRDLSKVYREKSLQKHGDDLSVEYTIDLLKKFELTSAEHHQLKKYCDDIGICYLCTPWDTNSLAFLESLGVAGYKVASADFTNIPLIDAIIKTKKPFILSTGMTTEDEIKLVLEHLNKNNATFALLHCNSTYPAPFHSINLRYLARLKSFHPFIGYSGHERGIATTLGAVALGAKIVERHFTLDRNMEGPDHSASLEFEQFKELINGIRELEQSLGSSNIKSVSQGEMINRENLAKSLVASRTLEIGHTISKDDIEIRSPGLGLSPLFQSQLIGKVISRNMKKDDYFFKTDITSNEANERKFSFKRPWGIPVRYHDFHEFYKAATPDLFEFHLSYSDMNIDITKFFDKEYAIDFVVHAPELFAESHLLDLATEDKQYRDISFKETQRVIDITRSLKKYFPKTVKPLIVVNCGGFSRDAQFSQEKIKALYAQLHQSLRELNTDGVEIIPQTMAPFPWHFGGQRYQNIFVHADEIVEQCKKHQLRMCLDISHSMLTCNHYKLDFAQFIEKVAPYTAHLHLGDAKGVDGEGLQIGDGEINFSQISAILNQKCPNASFIPEIWQGHKNYGEGFWIALKKLQNYF